MPGNCWSFIVLYVWDLTVADMASSYLLEHGLGADGHPDANAKDVGDGGSFETFFTETSNGKYVPRSSSSISILLPSTRSAPAATASSSIPSF